MRKKLFVPVIILFAVALGLFGANFFIVKSVKHEINQFAEDIADVTELTVGDVSVDFLNQQIVLENIVSKPHAHDMIAQIERVEIAAMDTKNKHPHFMKIKIIGAKAGPKGEREVKPADIVQSVVLNKFDIELAYDYDPYDKYLKVNDFTLNSPHFIFNLSSRLKGYDLDKNTFDDFKLHEAKISLKDSGIMTKIRRQLATAKKTPLSEYDLQLNKKITEFRDNLVKDEQDFAVQVLDKATSLFMSSGQIDVTIKPEEPFGFEKVNPLDIFGTLQNIGADIQYTKPQ